MTTDLFPNSRSRLGGSAGNGKLQAGLDAKTQDRRTDQSELRAFSRRYRDHLQENNPKISG